MSLLTIAQLTAVVRTSIDTTELQSIIDREEAEIVLRYGANYVDGATPVTEVVEGKGLPNLYLRRGITSVSSITERRSLTTTTATTLDSTAYYAWAGQGRITRIGGVWGALITVVYVPIDDNHRRRQALVELCRIALERTALKSESIAGEYSYQAPDWDALRATIYQTYKLGFTEV